MDTPVFRILIEVATGDTYCIQQVYMSEDFDLRRWRSGLAKGFRELADEFEVQELIEEMGYDEEDTDEQDSA
jgi:hypothetical protein